MIAISIAADTVALGDGSFGQKDSGSALLEDILEAGAELDPALWRTSRRS